jgi:hypothetical protein
MRPNSVPGTGSIRDGFHLPSGGGGGTAAGMNGTPVGWSATPAGG